MQYVWIRSLHPFPQKSLHAHLQYFHHGQPGYRFRISLSFSVLVSGHTYIRSSLLTHCSLHLLMPMQFRSVHPLSDYGVFPRSPYQILPVLTPLLLFLTDPSKYWFPWTCLQNATLPSFGLLLQSVLSVLHSIRSYRWRPESLFVHCNQSGHLLPVQKQNQWSHLLPPCSPKGSDIPDIHF